MRLTTRKKVVKTNPLLLPKMTVLTLAPPLNPKKRRLRNPRPLTLSRMKLMKVKKISLSPEKPLAPLLLPSPPFITLIPASTNVTMTLSRACNSEERRSRTSAAAVPLPLPLLTFFCPSCSLLPRCAIRLKLLLSPCPLTTVSNLSLSVESSPSSSPASLLASYPRSSRNALPPDSGWTSSLLSYSSPSVSTNLSVSSSWRTPAPGLSVRSDLIRLSSSDREISFLQLAISH